MSSGDSSNVTGMGTRELMALMQAMVSQQTNLQKVIEQQPERTSAIEAEKAKDK